MQYMKVDEALWASERIAELRVEDALHEIVTPAGGRSIVATANAVIEPGSILALGLRSA